VRESILLSGSGRLAAFLIADIQLDLIPAVTADSTVVPLSSQAYVKSKNDKYVSHKRHKYNLKNVTRPHGALSRAFVAFISDTCFFIGAHTYF